MIVLIVLACLALILLSALLLQVNAYFFIRLKDWWMVRKQSERFTVVDSISKLHELEHPELFVPKSPIEISSVWGFQDE